jgi:hypothetical protein
MTSHLLVIAFPIPCCTHECKLASPNPKSILPTSPLCYPLSSTMAASKHTRTSTFHMQQMIKAPFTTQSSSFCIAFLRARTLSRCCDLGPFALHMHCRHKGSGRNRQEERIFITR